MINLQLVTASLIAILREPPNEAEQKQCATQLEEERCRLVDERTALEGRCDKLEAKLVKLHKHKQALRAQYQAVVLLQGRLMDER